MVSSHSNLFIARNFLDLDACRELRTQAEHSVSVPAQVTKTTGRVDINMRQTSRLIVTNETEEFINVYFRQLQPQLEAVFDLKLSGFEKCQFLLYRRGDFYRRHADRNDKPEMPAYIKARRISAVIFLSNESKDNQPESYTGGSLVVWDSDRRKTPTRVQGEVGKLIAFPSDLPHEVEPVLSGKRYSIVNWFFK